MEVVCGALDMRIITKECMSVCGAVKASDDAG